jgi:DNA polymerase-1
VKHLLIDGDLLVYRTSFAFDKQSVALAKHALDNTIVGISESLGAVEGTIFLTGYGNFRRHVDPLYKANRKDAPRPQHGNDLRDYLSTDFGAVTTTGIEADDALGILQCHAHNNGFFNDTCIVSTDKDLDQIPGWHYNFTKRNLYWVTQDEADRALLLQLITGDVSDNVPGIRGMGPKKAAKYIDQGEGSLEELYCEDLERLKQNRLLLTILREMPSQELIGKDLYPTLKTTLDSSMSSLIKSLEEST